MYCETKKQKKMKNAIELNDYGLRELDSREVNEIQGGAYWWLLEAAAIAEAVRHVLIRAFQIGLFW